MPVRHRSAKLLAVALLVAGCTLLHYLTEPQATVLHVMYRELYFLPVILAAFWFGLKGGLATSLTITALYLPLLLGGDGPSEALAVGNLLQVILFNLVGGILGGLRDREQRRQRELAGAQSLAALGQAVSVIAHDLKSPLMAIGGFVNQVQRGLEEDHPGRRKLGIAIDQVARMEAMLGDMLAFARPVVLERAPLDLAALVEETAEVARAMDGENRVGLEVAPTPDLPSLEADRHRLQQALLNLMGNACEVSPPGETVTVELKMEGDMAWVEVADRGPGVPADIRGRLFEPFVTGKKGGTGLGLAITRKIAQAHGGRVKFADRPGGGTVFRLGLPLD